MSQSSSIRTAVLAAFTVAMFASVPARAAPIVGQLSLSGFAQAIGSTGMGAATGIDFVQSGIGPASPGTAGGLSSYGAGTGSFAGLECMSIGGFCGSIADLFNFSTSAPISSFINIPAGPTISFDLSTITGVSHSSDATGGSVTVTASGLIHETGFDNTAGIFTLTAQGNQITSYSATILAARAITATVPEPEPLALLGVGLAAVGMARRKRAN